MRVIPTSRSSEVKRKQCFEHLQPWERHANSKHTKRHHARHDFPLAFYSHLTRQLRGLWDVNGRLSLCPGVSDFPPPQTFHLNRRDAIIFVTYSLYWPIDCVRVCVGQCGRPIWLAKVACDVPKWMFSGNQCDYNCTAEHDAEHCV